MALNLKEVKDTLRFKSNTIHFNIHVVSGKEGDYFVKLAPSLMVSGYGSTEQEARDSFEENIKLFCEDFLALPKPQRDRELTKLGFKNEKFHTKNFSKAYVDKDGILHNFEPGTVKTEILEEAF
jgi:predicted RNase H-like HicB family nuclease